MPDFGLNIMQYHYHTRFVMTYTNDLSIFIFHITKTRYNRENGGLAKNFLKQIISFKSARF